MHVIHYKSKFSLQKEYLNKVITYLANEIGNYRIISNLTMRANFQQMKEYVHAQSFLEKARYLNDCMVYKGKGYFVTTFNTFEREENQSVGIRFHVFVEIEDDSHAVMLRLMMP